jgi:aminopeptidase
MKVTKIYTPDEIAGIPNASDLDIARKVLIQNLSLKASESILIVTDPAMEKAEAVLWFEAAKNSTPHSQMVVFAGMSENAQEPPGLVTLMMSKSKVVILQTTYSLSHTNARKLACKKGARVVSLPTVDLSLIRRTLTIDYDPIKNLSLKIALLLKSASIVHLTSPAGTDITMDLTGRDAIADTGFYSKPGDFGNLPAGEAFIAPVEGSAEGVFVVDGAFAGLNLDKPLKIVVKNGRAVEIKGGQAAGKLEGFLEKNGPDARNIAELGIGTNPKADPKGNLIEAEKAYGTVHIALGNNATFGGTVNVPFHSDGVILSPTLKLDGKIILDNGQFAL